MELYITLVSDRAGRIVVQWGGISLREFSNPDELRMAINETLKTRRVSFSTEVLETLELPGNSTLENTSFEIGEELPTGETSRP